MLTGGSGGANLSKRELLVISVSMDIKPPPSRHEDKVIDHNFSFPIRMNSEEEYSESNTIFGVFRHLVPRSVIKLLGNDARAIPGFRGDCCIRNYRWFLNTNNMPRSLATVWG